MEDNFNTIWRYDKFAPHIKARTKLQTAIIGAYKDPENGSRMIRGFLGNGSVKSEKENEGVGCWYWRWRENRYLLHDFACEDTKKL